MPETLAPLHDVNQRCIDVLVQSARKPGPGSLSLIPHLRDPLLRLTPEGRVRAAQRAILLTDFQFASLSWWRLARDHPTRPAPLPAWRGTLPRPAAIPLARATLMLAWHTLRSHRDHGVLLGIHPAVGEIISRFSLTEIDGLAERHFRHLRPRWEDRPGVWRALLDAAESQDFRKTRDFNLYALQLITGELWTSTHASR